MFGTIIKKEFMHNVLSFRFIISFILCLVLIFTSVYTLTQKYKKDLEDYRNNVTLHKKTVTSYIGGLLLAFLGVQIDKPPTILSTISEGMERAIGKVMRVSSFFDLDWERSIFDSNPMFALFGTLDLSFIVRVVMSLLAILFTYDAISGEKERGTLRLMLANALPRDYVILGKVIGGYLSLVTPFIISLLGGFLIMRLSPVFILNSEDWMRIGLILLISFLYIFVFFNIGLFVSSNTARSSTTLLSLLLIWAIFVLAIPKLSTVVAKQIYPIPSIQQIQTEKARVEQEEIDDYEEWLYEFQKEKGFRFTPDIFSNPRQDQMFENISRRKQEIQVSFEKKLDKQLSIAKNIARISPAASYASAVSALARTDESRQRHFKESVRRFKAEFIKYSFKKIKEGGPANLVATVDVSDMPPFVYSDKSLADDMRNVWTDIILLIFFNVFFFIASYISFLRYDVR